MSKISACCLHESTSGSLAVAATQREKARRLGSAQLGDDRGGRGRLGRNNKVELEKISGSREERPGFSGDNDQQSITPVSRKN
jgi:hypothetical protein